MEGIRICVKKIARLRQTLLRRESSRRHTENISAIEMPDSQKKGRRPPALR
jgi:hypothetical protein